MKRTFVCLLIMLNCYCDFESLYKYEKYLYLANNSNHSINLHFNNVKSLDNSNLNKVYPDTLIRNDIENWISGKILTNEKVTPVIGANDWNEFYNTNAPKDTISLFIFHSDTLAKYSWEEVRHGYKVLARYDLSLQDIKTVDFILSYPPDIRMEGIKLFLNR